MRLPTADGTLEPFTFSGTPVPPRPVAHPFARVAFAAAHVVSDPLAGTPPWQAPPAIDWDATLRFRYFLWDQGFGLAEAMDTSQRGMGLDWGTAKLLIQKTLAEAKSHPAKPRVACGAGTDQFALPDLASPGAIIAAYSEQMEAVEAAGGQCILMASRALPALKADAQTYLDVYHSLIRQAERPVILHWLGDMFDPALAGYWGDTDPERAADTVLDLIANHADKVDGIKISLLDQGFEERFRARLPKGVRLYTGDDFNYAYLIEGDGTCHSDALLGIFAAIAPAAAQALEALGQGDIDYFRALLAPTVPLSREIFRAPTQYYKAGVAFLAWLNGLQSGFVMPAGFQSSRGICHYAEVFRLADACGMIWEPDLATRRMRSLLATHGIVDT